MGNVVMACIRNLLVCPEIHVLVSGWNTCTFVPHHDTSTCVCGTLCVD